MSEIQKRVKQIQHHYLDKAMARRHCEDIEAYLEHQLRYYIKHAAHEILRGSVMTHRPVSYTHLTLPTTLSV